MTTTPDSAAQGGVTRAARKRIQWALQNPYDGTMYEKGDKLRADEWVTFRLTDVLSLLASPPAQQAGVEDALALVRRIASCESWQSHYGKRWEDEATEIVAKLDALRPSTDAAAQPTDAGVGERECQAVWRCAVGDVTSALDVLKNQWIGSKRKAERDAGAVLSGVLDLVWAYREPAAANYEQANASGKKLAERVRFRLAATPDGTGRDVGRG